MRKYEMMIILEPEFDERQLQGFLDQYLETITKNGGTVDNQDIWGRRQLAYEINKKQQGVYVVVNVTAEPHAVQELERLLTINEQVMRTKVIRPDTH